MRIVDSVVRQSDFLESILTRGESLVERARRLRDLSPEALNWSPSTDHWSPAQILEHTLMAEARYVPKVREALQGARPADDRAEIRHSWAGKMLIRAAGPEGNAPAPKVLHPRLGPYDGEVVDRFVREYETILLLARAAAGKDLSAAGVRNPFLPILRMNLTDCFELFIAHAERHIGQIEELRARPDFPQAGSLRPQGV